MLEQIASNGVRIVIVETGLVATVDPITERRDFLGRDPSINFRPLSKPQPRRTSTSVIRG